MALNKIEVPRRSLRCHAGQEEFTHGTDYISQLIENPNEGYNRFDYCTKCWKEVENKEEGIHWRSKVPEKNKIPQEEQFKSRNDKALYLLKGDINDAEKFVLGLLLSRFKVLIPRQELEQEGNLVTLYEVAESEEMITIPKVDLSTIETQTLQEEIAKKLHG